MRNTRRRRFRWTVTFLNGSAREPKVVLFRINRRDVCHYLKTYFSESFSLTDVAYEFGSGKYQYVAIRRGKIVQRGRFDIFV